MPESSRTAYTVRVVLHQAHNPFFEYLLILNQYVNHISRSPRLYVVRRAALEKYIYIYIYIYIYEGGRGATELTTVQERVHPLVKRMKGNILYILEEVNECTLCHIDI